MNTFVVVTVISIVFWGLTMLAIVNVILKDFGSMQKKLAWGVVALVPFIGWLIYFLFGAKKGIRKS